MTFSRRTLLAAVMTMGALAIAQDVQAGCRGRRGGFRGHYISRLSHYRSQLSRHHYGYSLSAPPVSIHPSQQQIAPQQQQQIAPQQQQQFAPQQQQQFAPQQQQQFTPQQQSAPQQTAPVPAQNGNLQLTALQALGGFAPPQSAPVQTQTPTHVGNWTATLGNGAHVQLILQADGNFRWSATNKAGIASSFSGRFMVGNGSLTLIRDNDSQRLEGSMTNDSQNNFSFKVAGMNTAAINFTRN
ncbi:MAG: hypothetical protein MK110_09910 [Fuerstiella sp.]|nr:hypothetical protein [Fuerstiella sp.]